MQHLDLKNPKPDRDQGSAAARSPGRDTRVIKTKCPGGPWNRTRPSLSFSSSSSSVRRGASGQRTVASPLPTPRAPLQRSRAPGRDATATRHAARRGPRSPEADHSAPPGPRSTRRIPARPDPAPPRALTGEQDVRKLHSPPSLAASASAHALARRALQGGAGKGGRADGRWRAPASRFPRAPPRCSHAPVTPLTSGPTLPSNGGKPGPKSGWRLGSGSTLDA